MAVVIALDAGTTGVRALAVGEDGAPVGARYREFPQYFPRPGWVEHDAEEIWAAVAATLADLLSTLDQAVATIGITNQRETVVVWDRRTGQPRHRAIVWQDRRGVPLCEKLEAAGHLDLVRSRTGLVLDPYFSATKLSWLLTEGGVVADAQLAFGTVDSWLLWKLTGGTRHATDPSNASRTLLFDIRRLAWDPELADLFGVPASILPKVGSTSGRLGTTAAGVVAGLPAGVPISGVAGDQQAALFGQACFQPGMTKNTYGTGSFVLMNVGDRCPDPVPGLLTTVAWVLERPAQLAYALEGAIFVTGAAVQWLRDQLGLIAAAAEVGPLAASVADTGGSYLVPALTGLGSPWWDPHARGTFVGVTRGVGRAQLARAVVEAMAFQTRDVVDAMQAGSGYPLAELRVDGGASVMDLLLHFCADLLGVRVVRAAVSETTALGAALLAGLAEGVWASPAEIAARWAPDAIVDPAPDRTTMENAYGGWQRAVERSRAWSEP
ncbi:MAG TPA: glycerol kinase GlpK [Acidimicrobiales bacterium]|jgi:glycerol kinase